MSIFKIIIDKINYFFDKNVPWINFPEINILSLLELILLTFILYKLFQWIKTKKAYTLLKGVIFLIMFYLVARILNFYTFLWFFNKSTMVLIICAVIAFQPEIRKALESLGEKNLNKFSLNLKNKIIEEKFSDKSLEEIIKAIKVMSEAKTGALILIEQKNDLTEIANTGIYLNADITNQILINIFEHNTPLHDGALIINNNKIISATCYLPLSENMTVNKSLGTRHRAALGVSEIMDCLVIVVSEETGKISVTKNGELFHNISEIELKKFLEKAQLKNEEIKQKTLEDFIQNISKKIKKLFDFKKQNIKEENNEK